MQAAWILRFRQWIASRSIFIWATVAVVLVATAITVVVSWWLYQYTVDLLTQQLRDRLVAIVRTAAVQFDTDDLDQLRKLEDYRKPEWGTVVSQLAKVRSNNPDVVFAYILRRSEDGSSKMVFVADADSLDPFAKIDLNHDGKIDDSDALVTPGTEYEDVPIDVFDGFKAPVANKELYEDQWGWLISGYAPIHDESGQAVAVMVVDIRNDNFFALTRQTFRPFLVFIVFLLAIITTQAMMLCKMWQTQLRQLRELDRQKDELLGIVSHQLATPISALKWEFEMLLDGDIGEVKQEQKDFFQKLQGVTAHLSDLVSMILDVSRIQLGRMKVDRAELDLNTFFGEVLNVMEAKARERKVNLTSSVQEKMGTGNLDKRLMLMITENLLSNAIKYTPGGGKVKLDVTIENGILKFSVSDTGCGIPKQDQDKIFGKLFRASNVHNVDGNGFGLYVVKGAAEGQGGHISFKSTEGKGTEFFVELPLKEVSKS